VLFTLGHSHHSIDRFVALLRPHGISLVVDVRSHPASRFAPQYGRHVFAAALATAGIAYEWLGDKLGGKSDWRKRATTPEFAAGERRVRAWVAAGRRPVLVCAEKDPFACHRALWLGRHFRDLAPHHLLADGSALVHAEFEQELLRRTKAASELALDGEAIQLAYDRVEPKAKPSQRRRGRSGGG